jgi:WD40 repeat protein
LLASGSYDTAINIWDARSGTLLHSLREHPLGVTSVALSASGELLASGSWDQSVKIWDAHRGTLIHTFLGHTGAVQSVALSLDGKRLASASSDGTLKLWSVPERRLIATFVASAGGEWVTWIPEGYFIGSPEIIEGTLRQFTLNETLYPEEFFPRDNPNPSKVAEYLSDRPPRDSEQGGPVEPSMNPLTEPPEQIDPGTEDR